MLLTVDDRTVSRNILNPNVTNSIEIELPTGDQCVVGKRCQIEGSADSRRMRACQLKHIGRIQARETGTEQRVQSQRVRLVRYC